MREFRDRLLAAFDVRTLFADEGIALKHLNATEQRFLCPFHDDHEESANVNIETGLWFCHACGAKGSPIDLYMMRHPSPSAYKDAITYLSERTGIPRPERRVNGEAVHPTPDLEAAPASATKSPLSEKNVEMWAAAGRRNSELMQWFREKRGYTEATVERFELGWDGQRVTIPIRDETGKLVNVRRYRDPRERSTAVAGKMIGLQAGMNEARLWPMDALVHEDVILVEGEWDAILMRQHGFESALTVTSGAGIFKPEWVALFAGKNVAIIFDNDQAGRRGAQKVATMLSRQASVVIVTPPNLPDKGDVTDFFVEQNRTREELQTLIADGTPFLDTPVAEEADVKEVEVPLHEASAATMRGVRQRVPVLLSGKATTPYTIPYKFTGRCDLSNRKFCGICPMAEVGGERHVTLAPSDPNVLSLINVSTAVQMTALKALIKAVPQCNRPQIEIHEAINVEELRLIPELDHGNDAGESEYVTRTGYFLGHGLRANRGYEMVGYAHPHPKSQATVHLLSRAVPAQDNISSFAMSPKLADQLRIFASDEPAQRFADIYDDFRLTVHRIQDRLDMQIAYDLVWHSVVSFYFNGAFVRRGWLEAMVMGDSGQGKTEMAMELLRHYGLGYRLPAEQTSMAGLIGGLEKLGDSWMLGWGAIPLNDKRLLIIDESQGLATSAIEAMSDVRATGVAEITKIRTERTNARCRLIWLANPVTGLTLSQHNQGVMAIGQLFKKPEDVRRLDFAITVASGDVRLERVNVRHDEKASDPRYPAAQSRDLLLWAWSRRPDQIEFTPAAVSLILNEATRMGRKYHASIPLVEPSDQRLKLARLAVAAAARLFASPDGEKLVVTDAHVRFVTDYLERVYCAPSMSYDEYSGQQRRGETLEPGEEERVRDELLRWTNYTETVDFFRNARIFKKSELTDVVGWPEAEAKVQLRFLSSNRLIRPTREGFVKTPAFIALLRSLGGGQAELDELTDTPDAAF